MKRCLIVDDSDVIRKVAKRILASEEMLVGEAATGEEALHICGLETPDIIVVDADLPDCETPNLIARLVDLCQEKRPTILLLCKEVDIGPIMKAKRAGADGYLLKPFTRTQFLESFRHLLSQETGVEADPEIFIAHKFA